MSFDAQTEDERVYFWLARANRAAGDLFGLLRERDFPNKTAIRRELPGECSEEVVSLLDKLDEAVVRAFVTLPEILPNTLPRLTGTEDSSS